MRSPISRSPTPTSRKRALVAPGLVLTGTAVVRGQNVSGITVEYGVDNNHPTGDVRRVG